ncbi:hypothetical protein Bpfe_004723 [Biomphalaria pfeifferi]|uniref:Uncharacterized protein n=1 Tax=Biomphalaria pfeifferi TaxID=112525 RepID=A0AAD8C3T8_BIOPF|nr:hypothetical protein Bpfe_004723 [Biomphalaria pfeifferi]
MSNGLSGSFLNTIKKLHSESKVLFSFTTQILQKKKILKAIGYQLSAVHPYDIQVFITKSLCQAVFTPFLHW